MAPLETPPLETPEPLGPSVGAKLEGSLGKCLLVKKKVLPDYINLTVGTCNI